VLPATTDALGGETVTVVTTGVGGGAEVTVTVAVPDLPAHDAVIVAEPAATPVTTPALFTVATPVLLLDQLIVWPAITFPCASFTVAESVAVAPVWIDGFEGETVTVVTTGVGGGTSVTVTTEVPLLPALVAVIVAEPAAIPATTPSELTAAVDPLLVDHDTLCPVIALPCSSFTVADKVVLVPTPTDAVDGATVTVVTLGPEGGVGSVVVPPAPEQTETVGSNAISNTRRTTRFARADICCMVANPGVRNWVWS
jgi:hypothetical protein